MRKYYQKNNYYIEKFKNAIKYGIKDYHKILQNIERDDESSILDLVTMPPIRDTGKYNDSGIFYADEKRLYLYGTHSKDDEDWGARTNGNAFISYHQRYGD